MKILRKQKIYAYLGGNAAKKIVTPDAIGKHLSREVRKSTEWIKANPFEFKPELLRKAKTKAKNSWFSKK